MEFTTGLKEFDDRFGEAFQPGTLMVIVGHPGSGKTSLALQLCNANAKIGHKCLYLSFQEDKEKLYRHARKLGFDLEEFERKGLFKHVRLPIMALVDDLIKELSAILSSDSYSIIVVDSINALLEPVKNRDEQRMILQNYFYEVSRTIKGIMILLAEIPLGEERVNLGSIEFVSDAVIILKHYVVRGLLNRIMEIRKLRGASLKAVEYPFEIVEGVGIRVFPPPTPERIFLGDGTPLKESLSLTREVIPRLLKGEVVFFTYDPFARSALPIILIFDYLVSNEMTAYFTSYVYSKDEVLDSIVKALTDYAGVSLEDAHKLVEKYLVIESVNPAGEALTSLYSRSILELEKFRPNFIIFHGIEVFSKLFDDKEYFNALVNELIWTRNHGVTNMRFGSCTPRDFCEMNASLSDVIVQVRFIEKDGKIIPIIQSWRRGTEPRTIELNEEVLNKLRSEFKVLLEKAFTSK
ncbi:RAD55 family ATPase [Thermosphaera sp.]